VQFEATLLVRPGYGQPGGPPVDDDTKLAAIANAPGVEVGSP
jgi:hypothetical protein